MAPKVQWTCKRFSELSAERLYDILHARCSVFVAEQKCVWLEVDNLDKAATMRHLVGTTPTNQVAAYARLLGPGTKGPTQDYAMISRVLTTAAFRGHGLGKTVMQEAIAACEAEWPEKSIVINAQAYLEPFYKSLGFLQTSELYEEDGIMHMDMIRTPSSSSSTQ
ncbi:hypothetical protein SPRG_12820 [Saprolegnia parasitica CBS 223.65]|uniref:N-acetyltransferase domain-containing protein n=1 Tax=Saprolegnia parasitica (strain CBS 223.65) TaxID=695850 RepID=A0A067C5W8_SAPPC|nr:hypothetical protein SPRG_12820 [Saprolegnia parasitica CBS 223.65]KDO21956.1 hypothetical protein SPRG_12820 [Saprolegnia parasitica CBS 223.65]|eukprot:XP_012207298.1 hypothetical protein SPRG_12820 [Saprolegnia parasitica CBS 223.65]